MTLHEVSRFLIEAENEDGLPLEPDSPRTFSDRLLMRLCDYPAFMTSLRDVRVIGNEHVELEFERFPEEEIATMKKIIGVEEGDIDVFPYKKKTHPMLAFRVRIPHVRPEEMVKH